MTVALFLIRVYQQYMSPLMPLGCRFYPTCSHYAAEAVARHGPRRGLWLGLRRILRCHPFSQGGFDPVPDAFVEEGRGAGHPPDLCGHSGEGLAGSKTMNPPLQMQEIDEEPAR